MGIILFRLLEGSQQPNNIWVVHNWVIIMGYLSHSLTFWAVNVFKLLDVDVWAYAVTNTSAQWVMPSITVALRVISPIVSIDSALSSYYQKVSHFKSQ